MLTNSRDIKRRLEQEGWILERIAGSHHVFKHRKPAQPWFYPIQRKTCFKERLGAGLVRNIYKQAGWQPD